MWSSTGVSIKTSTGQVLTSQDKRRTGPPASSGFLQRPPTSPPTSSSSPPESPPTSNVRRPPISPPQVVRRPLASPPASSGIGNQGRQVQINGKTGQALETRQVQVKSSIQASASQLQGCKAVKSEVQDLHKQTDDAIGHDRTRRTNSHRLYGGET